MNRVCFIIDGFNLYHSVRQAQNDIGHATTKWLDIKRLCEGYLYLFGRDATLERVYYFFALARHLESSNPDVTSRHRAFIECIEATGVDVLLNRFKKKSVKCPSCGQRFNRHEEKETDVAIAVKLLEVFASDSCDTAVLVTGDTDLAPAVRAANALFPNKSVAFAFPYRRKNNELKHLAPDSFEISKGQYVKHQLPDPFLLPNGREIRKPSKW